MSFSECTLPQSRSSLSCATPIVSVVDDDVSVRESLELLIQCAGLQPQIFTSAREFLAHPRVSVPSCLILDVQLPDINGLDLQQQIRQGYHPPIIFVTGHGDIPSSVRAIKAGALDFLTKPFSDQELLRLVHTALAEDCERRVKQVELDCLRRRFQSLTPREREVLPLVVSGLLNKQAAAHLGISEVTLQTHRTSVMRKMVADSLADLVRMADLLKIPVTLSRHL
jgi:FixJ family two-component response regulator